MQPHAGVLANWKSGRDAYHFQPHQPHLHPLFIFPWLDANENTFLESTLEVEESQGGKGLSPWRAFEGDLPTNEEHLL